MKLLASINTALRISVASYKGFQLHGIIEERAGKVHRTLLVLPGEIILAGAGAIAFAGELGVPVRSREERLVSLMARSPEMEELAVELNAQPISWGAMNTIYESAKGIMSEKKSMKDRRADHTGLVARGLLTEDESNRFYNTAGYYRHGHPREGTPTMEYTEALLLTKRLFWNLVDQLEPK